MNIEQARFNMIEQQIRPWDVLDLAVLNLLSEVKREQFVPEASRALAFVDLELPVGHGQVMLQPKLQARLVQDALVKATDRVLEIGTGTGYMTALLARMAQSVVSVEVVPELSKAASANLAGIGNVSLEVGDAARGWKGGPFDVIVMTGSQPVLPQALLDQLAPGGRFVGIVGDAPVMTALRVTRAAGAFETESLYDICAQPLVNAEQPARFRF